MVRLVVLQNQVNKGDDATALAIANKFQREFGGDILTLDIVEAGNFTFQNDLVIGSGEHCLKGMRQVKESNPDVKCIFSAHQVPKRITNGDKCSFLDCIYLPNHLPNIPDFLQNDRRLVTDIGIPSEFNKLELIEKATAQRDKAPWFKLPEGKKPLLVVLPGDAQDESGQDRFFRVKDAHKLAARVAGIIRDENGYLFLTNSPRTGKYTENTHKFTEGQEYELDIVTRSFINALKIVLNIRDKDFAFSDFKFVFDVNGQRLGTNSAYYYFLNEIVQKDGMFLVPGESISMINEGVRVVSPENLVIYENCVVNDSHRSFSQEMLERGLARGITYRQGAYSKTISELNLQQQVCELVGDTPLLPEKMANLVGISPHNNIDSNSVVASDFKEHAR